MSLIEPGRVEKAPARGQRISRQPWKAWLGERYLGAFPTKREAEMAVCTSAVQEAVGRAEKAEADLRMLRAYIDRGEHEEDVREYLNRPRGR